MTLHERYTQVQAARAAITNVETSDGSQFAACFRAGVELLDMLDADLADQLSVSRPTISRWMSGKNLPHPGLRQPVLAWINGELAKKERAIRFRMQTDNAPVARKSAPAPAPELVAKGR